RETDLYLLIYSSNGHSGPRLERSGTDTLAPCCPRNVVTFRICLAHDSRLSARLFGEVARPTDSKSMKVVKLFSEQLFSEQPLAKRKETYDWYPNHNTYFALTGILHFHGLYRDEHQDFKEEQVRLKKLRGKGKPRKGEGKRATKKK
uniref:Small ribosomal subunit protein mS33 n=1 Tax=Oryctolagus cuniculus TaxID=9986 RepID=A0A5F9C961_RABIT